MKKLEFERCSNLQSNRYIGSVHLHTIGKGGRLFGTASFKYLALSLKMATTVSSVVIREFTRSSRMSRLGERLPLAYTLQLSCIHTTSAVLRGKKKVKVPRVSKLALMREEGKTEEEIQAFIDRIVAKRTATQAYLAKLENVAEAFRNEFRIKEEKMKSAEGEQMKKEQEEKEMQARNMAFLLKNNEDLLRERYYK